jgi:hypothetical protein
MNLRNSTPAHHRSTFSRFCVSTIGPAISGRSLKNSGLGAFLMSGSKWEGELIEVSSLTVPELGIEVKPGDIFE